MAVLMTAYIPGGTQEMIDGMRPLLDPLRTTKGFMIHANGPVSGGWRVTEVWDSQADFEAWFESTCGWVSPLLSAAGPGPRGLAPMRVETLGPTRAARGRSD